MQGFSLDELANAKQQQNCWGDFYDLTKAYNIEWINKYTNKQINN